MAESAKGRRGGSSKGERRGGRQKGTPNRVTVALKDAIEQSFAELGGVKYLVRVGRKDPATYCRLLGKLLPKNIDVGVVPIDDEQRNELEDARRVAFVILQGTRAIKAKGMATGKGE